jgi:hypothetical protein
MRTVLFTLAAATLTLGLAGTTPARDPDKGSPGEVAKAAGKKLTVGELGQLLEAMGYEPKPVKNKDGKLVGYDIVIKSGTWTIYCCAEISPSTNYVWFSWTLVSLKDHPAVPPEALLAMLEEN